MGVLGFDGGRIGRSSEPGSHKPVNTVELKLNNNDYALAA